jgi:hypothetical protein
MHHSHFLLALALAGCVADPERAAVTETSSAALVGGDGLTLADATSSNRYILRGTGAFDCTSFAESGWIASELFERDGSGYLPPALARYCVVTKDSTYPGTPAAVSTFSTEYGLLSPDVAAVAGLGVATDAEVRQSFLEQVRPFPNYTSLPGNNAWLTLIDSSPTAPAGDPDAYEVAGPYTHGQQLATLALRATCDGTVTGATSPDCVVDVGTQLGLGRNAGTTGGPVWSNSGGYFGTQADLALAIESALVAWADDATAGPLVLNLSLGWHPEAGGDDLVNATAPVLAVYDALRAASCKDALVIAAVGQIDTPPGEPSAKGALYPAAWEVEDAPSLADCETYLGDWWTTADESRNASLASYTPLVYAASAVDVHRETLSNQRPDAVSVHAAAGSHLAFYNVALADNPKAISGTSAAAVVVSSAAAVVRSHYPTLDAHEVMALLRQAADAEGATGGPAYVCNDPSGGCPDTRYITVCESLSYVVSQLGGYPASYGYAATCGAIPAPDDIEPAESTTAAWVISGAQTGTCDSADWYTNTGVTFDHACPTEDMYGYTALPITIPQPPGNECPWCPAYLPDTVEIVTDSDMSALRDMTIGVQTDGVWEYFPLGSTHAGHELVVQLPMTFDPTTDQKIIFTYSYEGEPNFMYVDPIYQTW